MINLGMFAVFYVSHVLREGCLPADGAETTVGGHWNVFHSTCIKFALLAAQRCRLFPLGSKTAIRRGTAVFLQFEFLGPFYFGI